MQSCSATKLLESLAEQQSYWTVLRCHKVTGQSCRTTKLLDSLAEQQSYWTVLQSNKVIGQSCSATKLLDTFSLSEYLTDVHSSSPKGLATKQKLAASCLHTLKILQSLQELHH